MVPTTPWLRTILFLPGPHHVHVIASWFPCSCKGEYEKDRTLALGAGSRTRTRDILSTKQELFHLSYTGVHPRLSGVSTTWPLSYWGFMRSPYSIRRMTSLELATCLRSRGRSISSELHSLIFAPWRGLVPLSRALLVFPSRLPDIRKDVRYALGLSPWWELMGLNHLGARPSQAFPSSHVSPPDSATNPTGDVHSEWAFALAEPRGFEPPRPLWRGLSD